MTKNGYQVVMDNMKQSKKGTGDGNALDKNKSLIDQGNLDFVLKL
jgi:hypothetical protein